MDLYNIPQESPSVEVLKKVVDRRSWGITQELLQPCPVITLDGTWDDYLASLAKKQRQELRRKMRRVERDPSGVVWKLIESEDDAVAAANDFLELIGAVYHTSSGDLSVGTEFFKTYSMTDFMKYFHPVMENIEQEELGLAPARLTLRCKAVKKFLPYRGFYPAERVVQLSEVFDRSYMRQGTYKAKYIQNSLISSADANSYLNLRIENSKAQAIKPHITF